MHPIIQNLLIISLISLIQILIPWVILNNLKTKAQSTDISDISKERQEEIRKKYGGVPFYTLILFFILTVVFILTLIGPLDYLTELYLEQRFPHHQLLLYTDKLTHSVYLFYWGMLFATIAIELLFVLILFPLYRNNEVIRYIYLMIETSYESSTPLDTRDTIVKFSTILAPITIGVILLSMNAYLSLEQTKVQCSNFWSLSNKEINYEYIERIEYTKKRIRNSNHLYPRYIKIYFKDGENCNTQSLGDSNPDSTVDFLVNKTGLKPEIRIIVDDD